MFTEVHKRVLSYQDLKVNALFLLPGEQQSQKEDQVAIFTHGYTTHKGDVLPWAQRLAQSGVASAVFDQPGHFLGSFQDVSSFEQFIEATPQLFIEALKELNKLQKKVSKSLILGGHSLGALMAIKAQELPELQELETLSVGVGFGLNPVQGDHIFNTSFYKNTLELRKQLVSPALSPDVVFPWIKDQKEHPHIGGKRIHLICGQDDVVVGKDGAKRLQELLIKHDNQVSLEEPKRLPHHSPEAAAAHVYGFLKKQFNWTKKKLN